MECTYLSNHANILTEAGREASSSVLSVGEVFIATGIEGELKVLEVESELEDRLVRGAGNWRQGVCSLLDRVG